MNLLLTKFKTTFQNIAPKINPVIALIIGVILIAGLTLYFIPKDLIPKWGGDENTIKKEIAVSKNGQSISAPNLNEVAQLGNLEITLQGIEEGMARTLEVDEEGKRIEAGYFAIGIKVFNFSRDTKEVFHVQLTDNKGNQYKENYSILSYLSGVRRYGCDQNVYPMIICEGTIIFLKPAKADTAKKIRLTFYVESSKKKIVYEFES